MCSAHIFKVAYMYLYTRICGALAFFADTCSLTVRFCGHLALYVCPQKWTLPIQGSAKFQNTGIFNGAFLRANNVLLPNIIDFTLNFSLCSRCEIPEYWNFHRRDFLIKRGKIAFCQTAVSHRQRAAAPLTALEERGTLHPRRAAAP